MSLPLPFDESEGASLHVGVVLVVLPVTSLLSEVAAKSERKLSENSAKSHYNGKFLTMIALVMHKSIRLLPTPTSFAD